jgi:hypothetical protein
VSHGKVKQYLQPLPNKDKSGTVDHNFFMIRISKSRMPFFALNATYYNPKTESSASFSGHILFRIIANNKIRVFLETGTKIFKKKRKKAQKMHKTIRCRGASFFSFFFFGFLLCFPPLAETAQM